MTLDEAINILKQYVDYDNPDVPDFYTMEEAIEVVIKALEQEPCDDAISRHAVLDEMYKRQEDGDAITVGFIKKLPSVTVQSKTDRWIPVSERLPEVGQRVIATVESIDGNYVRETICGKYGLLCGNGIAWMPLPTPPNKSEIPTGSEGSDKE